MSDLDIVVDTREHVDHRFLFGEYEKASLSIEKIAVGDYSIRNAPEKYICIERKKSVEEIINNLTDKGDKERFDRELQKMTEYEHKYIICEFTLDELNKGSHFSKISPNYILSLLIEIQQRYKIHIYYAGKNAEYLIYRILKKANDLLRGRSRWIKQ